MFKTGSFLVIFLIFSCVAQVDTTIDSVGAKIKGLNLVSENKKLEQSNVDPILKLNSNYAAVIPFGFMPSLNHPQLKFNEKWQWRGEKLIGTKESIEILHKNGLKVMVKPQLWIGHGDFTGYIEMKSEEDWLELENGYKKFILTFAELSENQHVEMLCIGTELNRFVMQRSSFWTALIKEIRSIYSGELTYAENWDCYSRVPFWEQLDYIGVDAYFPITEEENPSKKTLMEGWKPLVEGLSSVSQRIGKKILFTEYGYRSITHTTHRPWDYNLGGTISEDAQVNALTSLFESVWTKDFFAGGFLWKWHPDHFSSGGAGNKEFTVQNKKAEQTVRLFYSK